MTHEVNTMSRFAIGSRVGAIKTMSGGRVHFYGYGVYDGDHEVPCDVISMTQEEYNELIADLKSDGTVPHDYVMKSPRITLDDGRTVWGSQCWWMTEDAVRSLIDAASEVINV